MPGPPIATSRETWPRCTDGRRTEPARALWEWARQKEGRRLSQNRTTTVGRTDGAWPSRCICLLLPNLVDKQGKAQLPLGTGKYHLLSTWNHKVVIIFNNLSKLLLHPGVQYLSGERGRLTFAPLRKVERRQVTRYAYAMKCLMQLHSCLVYDAMTFAAVTTGWSIFGWTDFRVTKHRSPLKWLESAFTFWHGLLVLGIFWLLSHNPQLKPLLFN